MMTRLGKVSRLLAAVAIGMSALGTMAQTRALAADEVVVFAAASLKNALDDVAADWRAKTGNTAKISLAGSSTLAKQIQQGAPADVFISANEQWMNALQKDKLIFDSTRRKLLNNTIVLIAHGKSAKPVKISKGFDLVSLLGKGKLAMAMVDSVPAGIYGKAALTSLDVWKTVSPLVAQSDNVRAALALVARGEAPYGIVYATDAAASDNVTIVGTFPENSHPPIIYPAAVIASSKVKGAATSFLTYLSSDAAAKFFTKQGFSMVAPTNTN